MIPSMGFTEICSGAQKCQESNRENLKKNTFDGLNLMKISLLSVSSSLTRLTLSELDKQLFSRYFFIFHRLTTGKITYRNTPDNVHTNTRN